MPKFNKEIKPEKNEENKENKDEKKGALIYSSIAPPSGQTCTFSEERKMNEKTERKKSGDHSRKSRSKRSV